jgi:hypothetical protein
LKAYARSNVLIIAADARSKVLLGPIDRGGLASEIGAALFGALNLLE